MAEQCKLQEKERFEPVTDYEKCLKEHLDQVFVERKLVILTDTNHFSNTNTKKEMTKKRDDSINLALTLFIKSKLHTCDGYYYVLQPYYGEENLKLLDVDTYSVKNFYITKRGEKIGDMQGMQE